MLCSRISVRANVSREGGAAVYRDYHSVLGDISRDVDDTMGVLRTGCGVIRTIFELIPDADWTRPECSQLSRSCGIQPAGRGGGMRD